MNAQTTITGLLAELERRMPAATALHYQDVSVSLGGLAEESRRVAQGLIALGVKTGDRVALWLPNTPAWLACFFACARIGAIALATNTRFRTAEMEDILGRSEAKVLVYWPAFRHIDFSAIVESLSASAVAALGAIVAYREPCDPAPPARVHGIPVLDYDKLAAQPQEFTDHANADGGCLMFTTSGTTKAPKFVLHTHRSIVQHAHDVAAGFGYDQPGTVGLGALPFCGTYGFSTTLAPLAAGKPVVIEPSFSADRVLDLIRRHKITNANLTGYMIGQLLEAEPRDGTFDSIRFCGCGTGCPEMIAPAARHGLRLAGLYGSSEVQALFSHRNNHDGPLAARAQGGGHPVSARAEVRVRDVHTEKLAPHEVSGTLEIRAPSQFREYFNNAEATRDAFTADGFFRTGDLGHTTPDGGFIFEARMGDALRLGGFLVSPAQIEDVLLEHPSIAACQVVGVGPPSDMHAYAFVVNATGAAFSEQTIIDFARSRMARYKVPARIVCLAAFPTVESANATKVQKARLREMAEDIARSRKTSG
jgi:fatty-acyl-CoA synthase